MTDKEQKAAAKKFAEYWKDKGYEKSESQLLWLSLLRDVYSVPEPEIYAALATALAPFPRLTVLTLK